MKKIILWLGFLVIFTFTIDVKAYGLSCDYELHSATHQSDVIATINISYDGINDPTITSVAKYPELYYYIFPDNLAINNIKVSKDDDTLTCPPLYWKFYDVFFSNDNYYVYFSEAEALSGEPDEYGTLSPLSSSWVDNENKPTTEEEYDSLSCDYKDTSNSYADLSFSILKNKQTGEITFSNIVTNQVEGYDNPKLNFNITEFKCPTYLSIKPNYSMEVNFDVNPSSSATKWVLDGEANYVEDNKAYATYVAYNSSTAPKINIMKDEGTYKAKLDSDITIKNMGDYIDEFSLGDTDKYPTYLAEMVGENGNYYEFWETRPPASQYKQLYLYRDHIINAVDRGEEAIKATCANILGDGENSFVEFLNNNVFKIIYIGIPILLILLTTFDFAKVVFVDDKDGIQAAGKRFGKRAVVAVLIYFVPTILIFVINLMGGSNVDECIKALKEIATESQQSN